MSRFVFNRAEPSRGMRRDREEDRRNGWKFEFNGRNFSTGVGGMEILRGGLFPTEIHSWTILKDDAGRRRFVTARELVRTFN